MEMNNTSIMYSDQGIELCSDGRFGTNKNAGKVILMKDF